MHNLPNGIPLRLNTKEVLTLVGIGSKKWNELRKNGIAPEPFLRGKGGYIYKGVDIARFLGLIDDTGKNLQDDPFIKGLKEIGRNKK